MDQVSGSSAGIGARIRLLELITEDSKMLVLSRKKGASIVIDGGIKVTVVEVKGSAVRLGIEAPKNVPP
jgi:hypothetical protein